MPRSRSRSPRTRPSAQAAILSVPVLESDPTAHRPQRDPDTPPAAAAAAAPAAEPTSAASAAAPPAAPTSAASGTPPAATAVDPARPQHQQQQQQRPGQQQQQQLRELRARLRAEHHSVRTQRDTQVEGIARQIVDIIHRQLRFLRNFDGTIGLMLAGEERTSEPEVEP
eukprot:2756866-Alexandrium_andersonii.AAC.2